MISTDLTTPESLTSLRDKVSYLEKDIQHYEAENTILREQVRLLRSQLYGAKTEKKLSGKDDGQALLFNEAEACISEDEGQEQEKIKVPAHTRKKRGRRPLPEDLPRIDVIHDLSDEEKECDCGCRKSRIGKEVSEQLEYIPAKVQVIRNIRYKYACKSCEGVEAGEPAVSIAPLPPMIIPKSIATPGLLAHTFTSKFADALPFYRQEKLFERIGIDISRSSMCNWAIKVAEQCEPLMELLNKDIRSGPLINIDETTVQVMKEPGRSNKTKSYMWIFRGGDTDKPLLVYQYHPTRSGDVASKYLGGYKGYVQTDGYGGYDFIDKHPDMHHVGCWAHARRKFVDVIKASGKSKSAKSRTGNAEKAVGYIGSLYAIEKEVKEKNLTFDEIYELRQEKSKPVLDEFCSWLNTKYANASPGSLLGKAMNYTLKQWDRLIRYIDDSRLRPDNNLAENAIRPFVVGRKSWLFSGNPKGAKASATLYSLIESAKANGLEPYKYLRFLFEKLPFASSEDDYKALLPNHLDKSLLPAV
jgi:transposase